MAAGAGVNWGFTSAIPFDANGNSIDRVFISPAGTSLQVAMAWHVASNCANYGNVPAQCPNQGPIVIGNFDLYLYETVNGVRSLKATSLSNVTSTNYRFLRFDGVATNATYDVVIKKNLLDLGNPPAYGLAWIMFTED